MGCLIAQAETLWANSGLPEFLSGGDGVTCFGLASPGGVPWARINRLRSRPIGARSGLPKAAPVLATPSQQPAQARPENIPFETKFRVCAS